METKTIPQPRIASREEWTAERKRLLAEEKAHTREYDRINAMRRRLPMVRLEKSYEFDSPEGKVSLEDLFEGRRQLIVYHFMFDPAWDQGCMGCTGLVDAIGDISMLQERDTTFVLISRAPLAKLEKYKAERGWNHRWVSSFDSDFNYDFHVTLDPDRAPVEYNFRTSEEGNHQLPTGESHGMSVFFRSPEGVCHTYSAYARGVEMLCNSYALLDITPYGRQEDFEDSPEGWPQRPTYG